MSDPSVVWLNGRLVPWAEATLHVEDRGVQFAESLYEGLPIVGGQARLLERHAARMRQAAEWIGLSDGVPDDDGWREIAARLIEADALDEALLYVQLTGGIAPRDHLRTQGLRTSLFAYARAFRFPRADDARRGLRVITAPDPRWARSSLKTTMLLPAALARREAAARGVDDVLWYDSSENLREATSSNVFAVEGRRVITPAESDRILPGITGPLVAEQAVEAGLQVVHQPLDRARLLAADEVFVSATTKLATGVIEIDGKAIGGGAPGAVTLDLAARLRRYLGLDPD